MKKNIFTAIVALSAFSAVNAQNFSLDYYSLIANEYNINPAYCAKGENLSMVIDHRQRAGLSSSNSMIGIRSIMDVTQGIGVRMVSDNRGAFQAFKLDGTYGNKFTILKEHLLYFGISGGLYSNVLNTTKINNYELVDVTDAVLQDPNLKSDGFIMGAGLLYEFKDASFSFSMPQLVDGTEKTNYNTYISASYQVEAADNIKVTPKLVYCAVPVVKNIFGLQVKGEYNQKFWAQMGFQSNAKFNIGLGCRFNNLGLGYHYSTANRFSKEYSSGTHEVVFVTNLNSSPLKRRSKVIRNELGPDTPPTTPQPQK